MHHLIYSLRSGKNVKLFYYVRHYLSSLIPNWWFTSRLNRKLQSLDQREDKAYILQRVAYYNRLHSHTMLPPDVPSLKKKELKGHKVYLFDTYQYTRWFPSSLRLQLCAGDVNYVVPSPSVVKSRPICEGNENNVILKLNRIRHFLFIHDTIPFEKKRNMIIFRGKVAGKAQRERFMQKYFGHPWCDLGDIGRAGNNPKEWHTPKMTIRDHLRYKFILALEGNDVASNLKWIMSSNSLAVMPRPTCETWFMEGTLIPNYHYVEIKPDFSDLVERLHYYITHPEEAHAILIHAHDYVKQFFDTPREELISLLVLQKYFKQTDQLE